MVSEGLTLSELRGRASVADTSGEWGTVEGLDEPVEVLEGGVVTWGDKVWLTWTGDTMGIEAGGREEVDDVIIL